MTHPRALIVSAASVGGIKSTAQSYLAIISRDGVTAGARASASPFQTVRSDFDLR